jgi:hypothetical protein
MDDTRTYSPAAEQAIASDAHAWMYGNVDASRDLFDGYTRRAHTLTSEQRASEAEDAWYANNLLKFTAINEVCRELGH